MITIPNEPRSIIHGIVEDCKGKPIKDAVVKLLLVEYDTDQTEMKPLTHVFTDEEGQFLFGPLIAHKHYAIKIWADTVKKRKLEIIDRNTENKLDQLPFSISLDDE